MSLALVDADRFKLVNDRFGHVVGDAVLRRLATILRANVRPTDFVARLGGDEFLVALPGARAADAAGLAERLRATVARTEWADLHPAARLTISVGVLTCDPRDQGAAPLPAIEALLAVADAALYAAKAAGRDTVEAVAR